MRVRTPHTENPRIPAPWQSAQGEADPKARPQRRSRWTAGQNSRPAAGAFDRLRDRGTKGERPRGGPSNRVGGNPETGMRGSGATQSQVLWRQHARKAQLGSACDVRTANRHRWVRRAASGERVKRGQGTRHNDPVTSEEGMPPAVCLFARLADVGRRESAQATV
jgi:hypothetical protein